MAGVMLSENAARRLGPVVRKVEGMSRGETPKKWGPRDEDGGGCESQNTIWDITIFGAPTGGTISFPVTANGVTATVTFNYNDSAATFKTTLAAGHSEIATTDLDVTGGPFPSSTMRVEFIGDYENTLLPIPTVNYGSLTGGTGRGVIVAMAQRGHG